MRLLTLAFLMLHVLVTRTPSPQEALPDGAEAITQMRAAYAACATYADTCSVVVTLTSPAGTPALWARSEVTTKFIRGRGLRVEQSFSMPGSRPLRDVLRSSPTHHALTCYLPGRPGAPAVVENASLEYVVEATYGATGLAAAPAQYVASLLLPGEFTYLGCTHLEHPVVEAVEPMCDTLCLRIRAEGPAGAVVTLWLDRDSWLLRRLTRDDVVGDLHRLTAIELHGAFGAAISPDELTAP